MSSTRALRAAQEGALLGMVIIPGNPTPASRPRVTRYGVYYGKHYTAWMKSAKASVRRGTLNLARDVPLTVFVECIVARPKTSKKQWPGGDCDNYAKGPLDVITQAEGWWTDDEQITQLTTTKRFANSGEEPRTVVEIHSA